MPEPIQVGAGEFCYVEVRTGTRCIKIWTSPKPPQCYKFDPDPHNDRDYNKNQAKFYRDAATAIAQIYNDNGSFPRYGKASITVNATTYRLDQGTCR
jgi:hypothetical protein